MGSLPCYKKTMENDYPLLRSILLDMDIPVVYRNVLLAQDNNAGMMHALATLGMLSPSRKKKALQHMGNRSGDRRWKKVSQRTHLSASWGGETRRSKADWEQRSWDTSTLITLCKLPIRRLVTDGTDSGDFNVIHMFNFVGMNTLADVSNVDLVRTMLATVPVPVLCSEMCSLHNRMENPPFLDKESSVGLLHYAAAMIATRYAFFTAGVPEIWRNTEDAVQDPCNLCIGAIIKRVQDEHFIHPGLFQAMRQHDIFSTARGGWSIFSLLLACASSNKAMWSVLQTELRKCQSHSSFCRKLLEVREPADARQSMVSLLEKMRDLIEVHTIDIGSMLEPYNLDLRGEIPDVLSVLRDIEQKGMLMDFVQDIYMKDEQLGTNMALLS